MSWFAVKVPHPRKPLVLGKLGQLVTLHTYPFLKIELIANVQNLEVYIKHSKYPEPLKNYRIWQLCAHICTWKKLAGAGAASFRWTKHSPVCHNPHHSLLYDTHPSTSLIDIICLAPVTLKFATLGVNLL